MSDSTIDSKLNRPITLPLSKLLYELLGPYGEHVKISNDLAAMLSVIDATEELYHVEFPNVINNHDTPVLWRVASWRESYTRHCRIKEFADLQRQVWLQEQDLIRRLTRQINHFYPPIIKELKQKNEEEAALLAKSRNYPRIKLYSVKVDDIIMADKAFAEFQRKLKEKKTGQKV